MRAIDAEELHNALFRLGGNISLEAFTRFERLILGAPSIDPVKHGHWIEVAKGYTWGGTPIVEYECSLCKEIVNWHKYPYCPHCGAKMGGDKE